MKESGYNQRQSVEGSPPFNKIFGESVMSRNWQNVVNKVVAKTNYMMIDMAR